MDQVRVGPATADKILGGIRQAYPNWQNFSDPAFHEDEIAYKREASRQAQELLSREALDSLINNEDWDAIVERLERVARATNLLYMSIPMQGDLGILYQEHLDRPEFSRQIFALLHGDGDAPERLHAFVDYTMANDLPNKWTFPTYFLFLVHPEDELFIKPRVTTRFLRWINATFSLDEPGEESYRRIRQLAHGIRDVLEPHGARDMIDIQSVLWVIGNAAADSSPNNLSLEVHPESAFSPQTFELLSGLHENPTRAYYEEHREDFGALLEDPFRSLVKDVANALPDSIRNLMETHSRIFSRIVKNDYGRGGAWDFYWAAFYPKGGKRIKDSQLFVSIFHDRFELGFAIGEYATERQVRFLTNVNDHGTKLKELMLDLFADEYIAFGDPETETDHGDVDFDTWLDGIEDFGLRAGRTLSREEILAQPRSDLVDLIATEFQRLFPLVLLSIESDPIPKIVDYLDVEADSSIASERYTIDDLELATGFERAELERWIRALERKRQIILYGPPGTGKTYLAQHLARHLVSESDGFVEVVQFHPAYTYEEFMEGIRPKPRADGGLEYPLTAGRFRTFCEATRQREGRCILIIDELNRANLSQVFGELMYLLEYRDEEISLAGGTRFRIPQNVRLIGTMNTADRSIALVDHALRRRFSFIHIAPRYDILERFHEKNGGALGGLTQVLRRLNATIGDPHYHVGISFFLRKDLPDYLEDIWTMEIEPYLEEYFYDQPDKVNEFRWDSLASQLRT